MSSASAPATPSIPPSRAHGYSILDGSTVTPQQTDPYWYDAEDPTILWDQHLSKVVKHSVVQPIQYLPDTPLPPKPADHLRFITITDTHNYQALMSIPTDGSVDVLLHAGDFSGTGAADEVTAYTQWIRDLKVKYKVTIAGNHDLSFDEAEYPKLAKRFHHKVIVDSKAVKKALVEGYNHSIATAENPFPEFAKDGGVAYLEDGGISIHGIRIWGSPWQPEFYDWGFNLPRGEPLRKKWDLIPTNTDVLITHGPPVGHGDLCMPHKNRAGCVDLLAEITTRIKPRYHVFGHIHEGYGQTTDGVTQFINPSSCNQKYNPKQLQPPIIFDMPIPQAAATMEK